jgi:hypothetical protein
MISFPDKYYYVGTSSVSNLTTIKRQHKNTYGLYLKGRRENINRMMYEHIYNKNYNLENIKWISYDDYYFYFIIHKMDIRCLNDFIRKVDDIDYDKIRRIIDKYIKWRRAGDVVGKKEVILNRNTYQSNNSKGIATNDINEEYTNDLDMFTINFEE